jgi:hypothetical protein
MAGACASAPAGGFAEEKTLDLIDVSTVGDEEHDVIVGLHHGVVMGHDHFVTAPASAASCAVTK